MRPFARGLLWLMLLVTLATGTAASKLNRGYLVPSGETRIDQPALDKASHRFCALTFDDGPDDTYTMQVLDTLERHNVQATFYLIGERVKRHPDLVRRIVSDGHEIGNHTFNHPDMVKLSASKQRAQLASTNAELEALAVRPVTFRPPYGSINRTTIDLALGLGLEPVLWSVDPRDWSEPGVNTIVSRVMRCTSNGAVILLHSTNKQTVEALPQIIGKLKDKGYTFVTVSRWRELVSGRLPLDDEATWNRVIDLSEPFFDPYEVRDMFTEAAPGESVTVDQHASRVWAEISQTIPDDLGDFGTVLPAAPSCDKALCVFSNFRDDDDLQNVWTYKRSTANYTYYCSIPEPAPIEPYSAEIEETPVELTGELPTLPTGEEIIVPPGLVKPDQEPTTAQDWVPQRSPDSTQAQPEGQMDADGTSEPVSPAPLRLLADWETPSYIDTSSFRDNTAKGSQDGLIPEPAFLLISYINNQGKYSWCDLNNYIHLACLDGLIAPEEFGGNLAGQATAFPWTSHRLADLDRGALVDLASQDVADIVDMIKRGKQNLFIVVRPSMWDEFTRIDTSTAYQSNVWDFVLFRQMTHGLGLDQHPAALDGWSLPPEVEMAWFSGPRGNTVVLYSFSTDEFNVPVPGNWRHLSQATLTASGHLQVTPITGGMVMVSRSPVILTDNTSQE